MLSRIKNVCNTRKRRDFMKRRLLAIILAAIAVFACFTLYGCDGDDVEETKGMSKEAWEALLNYENFQSVTLNHSVLGGYHFGNPDIFYRMDDGEYYVNGKKPSGNSVDYNKIRSLTSLLRESYGKFTYDEKNDVYVATKASLGFAVGDPENDECKVWFTDEGLSSILMTETVYNADKSKADLREELYEFDNYGASLSKVAECEHSWARRPVNHSFEYYCVGCHVDREEYEAAVMAQLDIDNAVTYKASAEMIECSYPDDLKDILRIGEYWCKRSASGSLYLVYPVERADYMLIDRKCLVLDEETKTYSVYIPSHSPMSSYEPDNGAGVFSFYGEGVVTVRDGDYLNTLEYHYYPDGRVYFDYGLRYEFDNIQGICFPSGSSK